jgi:hypothetical protein
MMQADSVCAHNYGRGSMHCLKCGRVMGHATWLMKVSQDIRSRYADGVPLEGQDARIIYGILSKHPRAAEKIGSGVAAIIVHTYIGGTRCFFVVRTDHTVIDFSVRKCLGRAIPEEKKPARIREIMARFNYLRVYQAFMRARHLFR